MMWNDYQGKTELGSIWANYKVYELSFLKSNGEQGD